MRQPKEFLFSLSVIVFNSEYFELFRSSVVLLECIFNLFN